MEPEEHHAPLSCARPDRRCAISAMIAGAALASPGVSLAAVKSKDKDDEETDAGESARSVDVLGIAFPVVRNKKSSIMLL